MQEHFIPVGLDTYFRGSQSEREFCEGISAGGNHLVVATASGRRLAKEADLRMRERELAAAVAEFQTLPESDRRPKLPEMDESQPADRPLPQPPENGLVIKGYCTYMRLDNDGRPARSREWYYKENPDRWAAETQSDMLWLTEAEWRSLVPVGPVAGQIIEVAAPIQRRFFCTIGIDYMEGSVNSLPAREASMTLTVDSVTPERITLRLEGRGELGKEYSEELTNKKHSRGCSLKVLGKLEFDRAAGQFTRFDVVGLGRAWGSKMDYTTREVRLANHPWHYGIAWELVPATTPIDRIPPYNLLHYNSHGEYWE